MRAKYSFPKSSRLLTAKDYFHVLRSDEAYFGRFIKIYSSEKSPYQKLGITVSKRYGKAHERNRFKRLVREAFRLSQTELPLGIQLNVLPIKKAQKIRFSDVHEDLLKFAERYRTLI